MDKNAIKKYAVWARRELIERVSKRAQIYGISEENIIDPAADSVGVYVLSRTEKRQRQALIAKIRDEGWQQVMEEAAYTWFNRFAALRFMEVNGYLPSHVRVFTNDAGEFKPQILAEAIRLELDGLDRNRVYELESANEREELYKYLIITQCNALSGILPGMFQQIEDYTELLFPDNMLREGSVIEQMVTMIPEQDWTDQVQIIGWLYQYYISEKKDKVFADLKKNIKISKENIPAATQLFTPDWIVRYMVENSLGRLYIDKRKTEGIFADGRDPEEMTWDENEESRIATEKDIAQQMGWKYFLPEATQTPEVRKQLASDHCSLIDDPAQLRVIDPCCGSGHILCVLFDVLVQIYEARGYTAREAAVKIVQNNLWGLDIDDRAAQLAYFTVMMKARHYDRRFFSRNIQPHVYAVRESNSLDADYVNYFIGGRDDLRSALGTLTRELVDAKEYGSILSVSPVDFDALYTRFDEIADELSVYSWPVYSVLLPFVRMAQTLAQKYDVVVTNPPYMGASGMSAVLSDYVKKHYPDSKSDLFAVFIEKCGDMLKENGYQAMITQHAWMFLSSYEKLRGKLLKRDTVNMTHLGARAFEEIGGEVVQTTSFVMRNSHMPEYSGTYCRLIEPTTQKGKEDMFLAGENRYAATQDNFSKIPGSPVAYWFDDNYTTKFNDANLFTRYANAKAGLSTTDNIRFLRIWSEVAYSSISFRYRSLEETKDCMYKYVPHPKGGDFRKWYGNLDYVVNWYDNGRDIKKAAEGASGGRIVGAEYYFKEGITWTDITTYKLAVRVLDAGAIFNSSAPSAFFINGNYRYYYLAFLNSVVAMEYLKVLSPTIHYNAGPIQRVPVVVSGNYKDEIDSITEKCIFNSKNDWNSFETSWDFEQHPFIRWQKELWDVTAIGATMQHYYGGHPKVSCPLELCYMLWQGECNERFNRLKANEEELNRIFIDIYGLQDELTPEVEDKDVTVRKADLKRDIRSFISYAVGCMFGRYSPDKPGLMFAGGDFTDKFWQYKGHVALDIDGNANQGGYAGISLAAYHFPALRDSNSYETATKLSYEPDPNNIIPVTDDEYFDDDIVGYFVRFVKTVYGDDTLEANLQFIADALGGKGTSRQVIRNYFLNDFYADHCRIYQKRPIYWLFDSGKKNGFKCLIYMHRYQPDIIARIRTDYVHGQQSRYRTAVADLEQRINGASASDRIKLNKQLEKIRDQAEELRVYEEKIHHLADQMISIDLDDGVKVNYAKFQDVLAKIK
ncbi:MAG: BREX-1 system adenine-specific DNA-methyltransferase PglX [Clostridia bacterium]|nr:BREX-1 system adenine-specific DNA-methyltransferase PglX [Clostridia bacterium]